jgi:hypothetical protein
MDAKIQAIKSGRKGKEDKGASDQKCTGYFGLNFMCSDISFEFKIHRGRTIVGIPDE